MTYQEKYKLNSIDSKTPEEWWNSLSIDQRAEVFSIAFHFNLITANSRIYYTPADGRKNFIELTKRQSSIVRRVFKNVDRKYNILHSIAGTSGAIFGKMKFTLAN